MELDNNLDNQLSSEWSFGIFKSVCYLKSMDVGFSE